jgi:hypothetical protein
VRERRDAVAAADLGVGERVVDRGQQVVDRRLEALQERRRQPLRAGLDVDPRRLQVHAVRIGLAHLGVDLDERLALAVDRDLELLALDGAAEELPGRDRVQHQPEAVVAVRREVVDRRDPAARAERRARDVLVLRRRAIDAVRRLARPRGGIAQRQAR